MVAVGGALGALARYGASRLWMNGADAYFVRWTGKFAFPWTTLLINVLGCLLMGVLTVALKERFTGAPKLLNPLLGTGFLGGFTTFSSYADDTRRLFENGEVAAAVGYLALTATAAMVGVALGVALARVALVRHPRAGSGPGHGA